MDGISLILDFDSTFIQVEALEELASIALDRNSQREKILSEFHEVTKAAMEGKASYADVLNTRVSLLQGKRDHIEKLISKLQCMITPSIKRNKAFFEQYHENIYIISGGFQEIIWPIIQPFSLLKEHLFANSFLFDYAGNIIGYDRENPLSQDQGKVKLLRKLNLPGKSILIGDGYNDYEARAAGCIDYFYAFTENVHRNIVAEKADAVLSDFDHFLIELGLRKASEKKRTSPRVLLLEGIHPSTCEYFKQEDFEVHTIPTALSEDDLIKEIKGVNILGVRSKTRVTEKVLKHADDLLAIGAFCIGVEQIDLDASLKKGIAVFNAPYSNTRSVVELAIGEMIMLLRKVFEKSLLVHRGEWNKSVDGAVEVRGKKLGIIGYGNIGSQLSVLAESLGMNVYYYDTEEKLPLGNAQECSSMEELLKKVDVISLHVNGCPENINLIDDKEIQLMRDGVVFLNLSRGDIVNQAALAKAIRDKKIFGAAVDVYPREPKGPGEPIHSELQNLHNVILTPHIGGNTIEAQKNIGKFVATRLIKYLQNGSSRSSVNFPEVRLPEMQKHRFINIHENMPGMVAQISGVLTKHNINIEGQYLQTNEKIGYTIIDTSSKYSSTLLEELENIPHTIKVRIVY
uniref:D-3-phosphoglycerate dehydrogenase n=1 Tax=uncultured bacterium W5-77b TaxID=1131000 RepID=H9BWF0_9BACT|nr:D-3-phosphoglycerate dehydrogenase [uncultured bacterium W5-77b]